MVQVDKISSGSAKQHAMEVAEEAREKEWQRPSFLAELFLGNFRWDMVHPYPEQAEEDKKIGDEFLARLQAFLVENLDSDAVDRTGEIPPAVIRGLVDLGCFAMKIPKKYGGLGLSQTNYNRAISLISSYCGSTAVWLSAHQSIGVPQPLLLFGTEEQKQRFLPRFRQGAVSAFALTELEVGSDPANMKTTATPIEGGNYYLLNGEKLWCTNGTVADILVVMAQTITGSSSSEGREKKEGKGSKRKSITAFIVEKTMPGFEVVHRCQFMGLRGIQNGLIRFRNVKVPKENIIWGVGQGLKLALITLNTGRLTIPAATTGMVKLCLKLSREWAMEREQWGGPIGYHEAIASKIAHMAASAFAMEAVTWFSTSMADQKKTDIRLEAAMSKLFCTEASWRIADDTVQIRGGRGYETADSLRARGEKPIPAERILRDCRINLIIEGTSEIMRLFIAREALDHHLKFIFPLLNPKTALKEKMAMILSALRFYALWYPACWLPRPILGDMQEVPPFLREQVRYVGKTSRRLARSIFHVMMLYQEKLEQRQQVLFRIVNIGSDLFAIAAAVSRAAMLLKKNPSDQTPIELADLFCREARRRIRRQFRGLYRNDDPTAYRLAKEILEGKLSWLEQGIISPTWAI